MGSRRTRIAGEKRVRAPDPDDGGHDPGRAVAGVRQAPLPRWAEPVDLRKCTSVAPVRRTQKYAARRGSQRGGTDPEIGCVLLSSPIFAEEAEWITRQAGGITLPRQVVKLKYGPALSSIAVFWQFRLRRLRTPCLLRPAGPVRACFRLSGSQSNRAASHGPCQSTTPR